MIKNYLLITLRNLLKNKLFIFINVFGIGIAVACCITAYLNWQFDKNWDAGHKNAERIYRVQFIHDFQGRINHYGMSPIPLGNFIKQNNKEVDEVVRFIPAGGDFRVGDELFGTGIAYADSAFFDLFTYDLKYGTFNDFRDKSKIFIDDELARKYFNKEDVVGQPLTQIVNGKPKEYIVGGVFKKPVINSSFYSQAFTHWDNYWETVADSTDNEHNWKQFATLFLRIDDPSKVASVTKNLEQYVEPQNIAREDFKVKEYYLENFKGMAQRGREEPRVQGNWLRGALPKLAVTAPAIMAIFLLLLACFNFTNTSIAVSSRRLKEIGVRKVMGGVRSQMILQFLGENLLLCVFGLIVGLIIAEFLVPAYDSMWNWLDLSFSYLENLDIILFLLGLLFFTAILAGSYPAFYITSFEPVSILKGKAKFGGTNWFTRILLGLQFFISLLAIIFSVAFQDNAAYQRNYDLGFLSNGVVSVWIKNESEFNTYRDALVTNKDIEVVAGTNHHVATSFDNDPVKYEDLEREVDVMNIGDDYMEAMDIKLVAGRSFKKDSETDRKESILVTEEFVKSFGWKDDPIGKRIIWMDTAQLYVIGVVKNIYARALWEPIEPMMLRYTSPDKYRQVIVRTSPEKVTAVNDFMEDKWETVFPNSVYNGRMITEEMAETDEINTNVVKMFGFLGFFAILLSVTGLYTLVSLNIIKKMKEIGVRKVLGASIGNIARVINLEFIVILSIAGLLGGAAGYFLTDLFMANIWEYYKKLDVVSFGISMAIMFFIAALAVSFKTFSTASLNPTKTLRDE
jgi:ABC-type antimicrobial peptide transport system permease subunit